MNMNKMKNVRTILCLVIAVSAFIGGCESTGGTGGDPGEDNRYTLNGLFVQDINLFAQKIDTSAFAAVMTKDLEELQTAQIFFGNSALGFDNTDSIYAFTNISTSYLAPQAITMNIVDSTFLAETVSTVVIDSLWIKNYPDSTIPNTNGTSMFVEWSSAANIDGYIVAVVPAGSEYTNVGYSVYVTELGTSTTIPPDAFRVNNVVVTGWYNFYVYGYAGSPDLALSSEILPVALPSQLPDNISLTKLTGHFGSIVVSRKKMIQVVSN